MPCPRVGEMAPFQGLQTCNCQVHLPLLRQPKLTSGASIWIWWISLRYSVSVHYARMQLDAALMYSFSCLNSGAHGVGFCHCSLVTNRLYDYQGTGLADPRIDPAMLASLKQKCPPEVVLPSNITKDTRIFLNQATLKPFVLDTSFYQGLFSEKAVLELDQGLAFTDVTSKLAARYARRPKRFIHQFSKSMIKLGYVGVLTGADGEIRLNCRKVNNGTQTTLS